MLDNIIWRFFEKTGSIDTYLLYVDIKSLNKIKEIKTKIKSGGSTTRIN